MKWIAFKIWLIAMLVCTIIYIAFLGSNTALRAGLPFFLIIMLMIEIPAGLSGVSIFIIAVAAVEKVPELRRNLFLLLIYTAGLIAVWISIETGFYILSIMMSNRHGYKSLTAELWGFNGFHWAELLLFCAPALVSFTLSFLFHLPAFIKIRFKTHAPL